MATIGVEYLDRFPHVRAGQFTAEDFHPASFTLGYMSAGRRAEQFVMQPVWVAVLTPARDTTMGHVVAVPAATKPFGTLAAPRRGANAVSVRTLLDSTNH
jgi:hypothetical protein